MPARPIAPGGVLRIKPQPVRDSIQRVEERKPRPPALAVKRVDHPTAPAGALDRVTVSEQSHAALRGESDRARAELAAIERGRGADRRPLPLPGSGQAQDARRPDAARPVADRARPLANGAPSPSAVRRVERPGFRPGERRRSERDLGRRPEAWWDLYEPPGFGVDTWV